MSSQLSSKFWQERERSGKKLNGGEAAGGRAEQRLLMQRAKVCPHSEAPTHTLKAAATLKEFQTPEQV